MPRDRLAEFVELTSEAFRRLYPDFASDPAVTPIIDDRNVARVTGLIGDARDKGATLVEAGTSNTAARRIAPTLLLEVTEDMAVTREEVFGPVLTVYPYDEITEVVEYVTAHPAPLTAYWYGEDSADFRFFRHRTTSGGITRNDYAAYMLLPDVPFGGVGRSGTGSYNGKAGFDTFSHRRAVATTTFPGGVAGMLGPASMRTPAVAEGMRAQIAGAYRAALDRLGR
ncbi:acyl-CoA reductase-like NAD-dependent aldehyde dehydrogenase [Catenuloplanes niger]|uniref:Acyl-CoA reductase-like NAD-dependent aldehyde dehydrogenase n=1 Tax=Catenuloplanes niger TaxID=587534 RepID=A0AAE3ZVC4_9ACTN|nr:acyl-CoA reductase-like NAD-dependent aldehyde dehydrogenase [Catenuloplanes niger]